MARQKIDKETKKQIISAKKIIEEVAKADGNEAETRRRVERIFEQVMGYDVFKHMSREYAVKGAGETEYCDWVISVDEQQENAKPYIFVELKRVNVDLAPKHLKQVSSYAINAGCEWVILTNGKDWRLYHISFGQPPETKLVSSWHLLNDDPATLAEKFDLISYRNVKRGRLEKLWQKTNVLTPRNMLDTILSEDSLKILRRQLRKTTGINILPEDIIGAIRKLLNEVALTEMSSIKVVLPERKKRKSRRLHKQEDQRGRSHENVDSSSMPDSMNSDEKDS